MTHLMNFFFTGAAETEFNLLFQIELRRARLIRGQSALNCFFFFDETYFGEKRKSSSDL